MTLAEFIEARLAAKERGASGCMNCGEPIRPHTPSKTGYTHGDRTAVGGGWQGIRCPGKLTGAQPWPDPARVLREVEAMRAILALHQARGIDRWQACTHCRPVDPEHPDDLTSELWPCRTLRALTAVWSDHPDYDEAWRP